MSLPPVQISTLAQWSQGSEWRVALAHDRPEHVLIWLTRGQGRLLLNGTRRGLTVNNFISLPPRHLFALDAGRNALGMVAVIPYGTQVNLPETPRQMRLRDVDAISELSGIFDAANREANAKRALSQDALDAHVSLMAVWLRRQIAEQDHLPSKQNAAGRLSQRFCARISELYHRPMSMADHAEALGVTPTHLTRACKAATGKTAADLLTERILHAARFALEETNVAIQDIARHLGFGSAAYFTRFISAQTGLTPSAIREQSRRLHSERRGQF